MAPPALLILTTTIIPLSNSVSKARSDPAYYPLGFKYRTLSCFIPKRTFRSTYTL